MELRSLVTSQNTLELSLHDVPVPTPADNEVLVRVEAAPINPSDLGLLIAGADMTTATVVGTPERPSSQHCWKWERWEGFRRGSTNRSQ